MKLRKMLALSRAVGRNEVKKVEALCSEALAADPGDLMALMALADAYWRNQRREDALTLALQALEVQPNEFYALRIVAGVYAERGEHEPVPLRQAAPRCRHDAFAARKDRLAYPGGLGLAARRSPPEGARRP